MKISPSLLFSEINEVRLSFQFKTLVLPMRNLVYHFILHTRVAVHPSVSPPDSLSSDSVCGACRQSARCGACARVRGRDTGNAGEEEKERV